jgi:alkylation response protein AidB-like acyl-CoA dehydrogenase
MTTSLRDQQDALTSPVTESPDVIHLAKTLANEFRGHAAELDRTGAFPFANYERMRQTGYLRAGVPTELGGMGAGLATLARAQQELARGCPSTALAVNMHVYQVGAVADGWRLGAPVEGTLRRVANEGIVLASTASEAVTLGEWRSDTVAQRDGEGYRLTGRKAFCSQAPGMTVFRLIATHAETGESLLCMVPASAEGVRIIETWDTTGMRATASHDVELTNVWIPDALMGGIVTPKPMEFPAFVRSVVWFHCLLSSVYLGIAEEARDEAYRSLPSKVKSGARDQALTDMMLGQLETDLLVATATRDQVVGALDADRSDLQAAIRSTILCKQIVTEKAIVIVSRAVELAGGRAYFRTSMLERLARDVMAARFHPPAAPVSYQMVGESARLAWSRSA